MLKQKLVSAASRRRIAIRSTGEMTMAYSGPIRPLYGVIIRDKCKTADAATLKAYKIVAEDLLKDHQGPDAADLKDSLKELNAAIAKK